MYNQPLFNLREIFPGAASDFFFPWSEWLGRNNIFNYDTVPALNVSDDKERYKITVAAPGLEKGDFDIAVEDDVLTISAASEKEKEEEKKKYRRREYSYSGFCRTLTLPSDVDTDAIEATYENGILTLGLYIRAAICIALSFQVRLH
ncbi:hypothetical protein A8C56_07435 [Niabella ginsenosidivorans]|uniref:SHSP domain-containing protein n=1 Tax=Niabella ginsenosidivorans TaxID=1176587 RepID=A0A1A9I0H2_9BACT|nr:Hsp20/alpha crystallin family protein [Niabella ginsenosidivorans]ANH80835.1 hypothetical protein A8C56_07435 [Niabella ginsenosidivorans]